MKRIQPLLGPMRLPFLILTPACVLLGLGAAIWTGTNVNFWHFALVMFGAVCAHISVNAFNEYDDFKSGLDFKTKPTPFSGGSGTLPTQPELSQWALKMAWGTFAITALIGFYFLWVRGWGLLPLGLLGLLVIYTYTPRLTHNPMLCLLAPGFGFGPLMVMGTYFALTGQYSWTALVASLVPLFLVSDLLLLNQFPDIEADQSIGRRHFPILLGRQTSSLIYALFLFLAFMSIVLGVIFGYLPTISLFGLLTLLLAVPTGINAFRHAENLEKLIPTMGQNVMINILTPILVAIGLLIA
jgi:1,4-dihydroxy-2-naphthoate polyprenyltransferase